MIKNTYPGKFIVLEGPEGGGKSTQAMLLARALEAKGCSVCLTQEPTKDGVWGKLARFMYKSKSLREELPAELARFIHGTDYQRVRESANKNVLRILDDFERITERILLDYWDNLPMLMQLCFIFDRHDHRVRVEIPALGEGKHVISDRDFLSTLAYGASEGLDWRRLLVMHEEILGKDFVAPDLILLLDVAPEVGLTRTAKKHEGAKEYFDDLETQKKIRNAYLEFWEDMSPAYSQSRMVRFNAVRGKMILHRAIVETAEKLLSKGFS